MMSEYRPTGHRDFWILVPIMVAFAFAWTWAEAAAKALGPPWIAAILGIFVYLVLDRTMVFFGYSGVRDGHVSRRHMSTALELFWVLAITLASIWLIANPMQNFSNMTQHSRAFCGGLWLAVAFNGFARWLKDRKVDSIHE